MTRLIRPRSVLAVRDLARSTQFYVETLGFQKDAINAPGWSFLSRDATSLMLGECPDEVDAEDTGNHSWFLHVMVEGVDALHEDIRRRGGEIVVALGDRAHGHREFVVRSPDGHRILFGEPIGQVIDPDDPTSSAPAPPTPSTPRYDAIGTGYARYRREDPRFAARIHAALGDARTIANVGAGAGSYEPRDRHVTAIEPSDTMAAQRDPSRAPAIRGWAHDLPLRDDSVDAAMAVLTMHHWDDRAQAGVQELRRVARDQVVILTYDPAVSNRMWLMAEYLPEVAELDARIFPDPKRVAAWLGGARIEPVLIPADTPDWMLGSFWAHPERVLDAGARAATSGFARQSESVVDRVVTSVARDLATGDWNERHGHLRELTEYDAGLRLIVASTSNPPAP